MALMTPVSGPYTGTYNPGVGATAGGGGALALGIQTDDGFQLLWTIHKQRLGNDGTDQYGLTLLENIYRGADWSVRHRGREYAAGLVAEALPYGRSTGGNSLLQPILTSIGAADDGSTFTGVLVLTAVSGTPAASAPATLTASHAIQADGQQNDWMYTSKERQTPQMLNLLPYTATLSAVSRNVWFVTS